MALLNVMGLQAACHQFGLVSHPATCGMWWLHQRAHHLPSCLHSCGCLSSSCLDVGEPCLMAALHLQGNARSKLLLSSFSSCSLCEG